MGQLQKGYIYVISILKAEREKGTEEIFEVLKAENFPKIKTDTNPRIQEAQSTTNRINNCQNRYVSISYSNCKISKIKRKS